MSLPLFINHRYVPICAATLTLTSASSPKGIDACRARQRNSQHFLDAPALHYCTHASTYNT